MLFIAIPSSVTTGRAVASRFCSALLSKELQQSLYPYCGVV